MDRVTFVLGLFLFLQWCLSPYLLNASVQKYNDSILGWKTDEGQEYVIKVGRRWYDASFVICSIVICSVIMVIYLQIKKYITTLLLPPLQPQIPPQPLLNQVILPVNLFVIGFLIGVSIKIYTKSILAWKIGDGQEYVVEVDGRWYTFIYIVDFFVIYNVIMATVNIIRACIAILLQVPQQPNLVRVNLLIENLGPLDMGHGSNA